MPVRSGFPARRAGRAEVASWKAEIMAHIEYPDALIEEARKYGVQLGSGDEYDPSDALETLGAELQETASMNGDVGRLRFAGDLEEMLDESADFGFSFKKLGRGIGRGLKKIVKNPVVQVLNPAAAIAVHTSSKALGGKGTIRGPIGKVVDAGTSVVMSRANVASVIGKNPLSQLGKSVAKQVKSVAPYVPPQVAQSAVKKTITPTGVISFGIKPTANIKSAMSAADRLLGDRKIANSALVVRNTKALAALGDPSAKRGLAVLNAVGTIRAAKKIPAGKPAVAKAPVTSLVVQKTSPAKVVSLAKTTVAKKAADKAKEPWYQKVLGWFGLEVKP